MFFSYSSQSPFQRKDDLFHHPGGVQSQNLFNSLLVPSILWQETHVAIGLASLPAFLCRYPSDTFSLSLFQERSTFTFLGLFPAFSIACHDAPSFPLFFHLHFLFCLRPSMWSFCCGTDAQPILSHNQKEKEPRPKLPPRFASLWGVCHCFCFPFSFCLSSFLSWSSLHFFHHFLFLCFTFFFLFFFISLLPLLFLSLFLNSPLFHQVFLRYLGPFPGCFYLFLFANVPLLSFLHHRSPSSSMIPTRGTGTVSSVRSIFRRAGISSSAASTICIPDTDQNPQQGPPQRFHTIHFASCHHPSLFPDLLSLLLRPNSPASAPQYKYHISSPVPHRSSRATEPADDLNTPLNFNMHRAVFNVLPAWNIICSAFRSLVLHLFWDLLSQSRQ